MNIQIEETCVQIIIIQLLENGKEFFKYVNDIPNKIEISKKHYKYVYFNEVKNLWELSISEYPNDDTFLCNFVPDHRPKKFLKLK